jgi:hypothetical protein
MKPLTLAFFLLFLSFSSRAQIAYWQQSLQYQITVSLDDKENTLDGTLKLNYKNIYDDGGISKLCLKRK